MIKNKKILKQTHPLTPSQVSKHRIHSSIKTNSNDHSSAMHLIGKYTSGDDDLHTGDADDIELGSDYPYAEELARGSTGMAAGKKPMNK